MQDYIDLWVRWNDLYDIKDIKNNYKTLIYGNPKVILEEIKYQVKPLTYNKIENLYMQFKDKIDNFTKNIKGY